MTIVRGIVGGVVRDLRLEPWHRRLLYSSFTVLGVTGIVWLMAQYWPLMTPFAPSVNGLSRWSSWAMRIHGGAAMLALFIGGTLLNQHIRPGLKNLRNRRLGVSLITGFLILVISGYGLYYFAPDEVHQWWSVSHWLTGLIVTLVLPWHVRRGHRSHRAAKPEAF